MSESGFAVAEPASAALHNAVFDGHVDNIGFEADAAGAEHIEFGDSEWGCDLVLDDPSFHTDADSEVAILESCDATHIDSSRTVEFQSTATGRRFRATEHHSDLFPDLVDEDHATFALGDRPGQFPHRLAHHPSLQSDVGGADFAIEFNLGHQCGDRVDDDQVDGVGLDQHLGDLQSFFAVGGLADEEFFEVDSESLGP